VRLLGAKAAKASVFMSMNQLPREKYICRDKQYDDQYDGDFGQPGQRPFLRKPTENITDNEDHAGRKQQPHDHDEWKKHNCIFL